MIFVHNKALRNIYGSCPSICHCVSRCSWKGYLVRCMVFRERIFNVIISFRQGKRKAVGSDNKFYTFDVKTETKERCIRVPLILHSIYLLCLRRNFEISVMGLMLCLIQEEVLTDWSFPVIFFLQTIIHISHFVLEIHWIFDCSFRWKATWYKYN